MSSAEDRDPRVASWLQREAPAGIDESVLTKITEHVRSTPQRRSWAGPLSVAAPIIAGTVAIALLAAVVMVLIPRGEDGRPLGSPDVGASLTPGPFPTESPAADGSAEPATWSAVGLPDPRPEEIQGETPNDVAAGGPGFVAVGRSYAVGDNGFDEAQWTAAIWTSVDGAMWELAEDLDSLGPAELRAVAAGPNGRLLAVGFDMRGIAPDEEPPTGVGMWRSGDGIRWESAPAPDDDQYTFIDVVGTDEAWLVAGYAATGGPTIFISRDLETWTEERLPASGEDEIDGLFGDGGERVLAFGCDHPVDEGRGLRAGCVEPTGWLRSGDAFVAVGLPILPVAGTMIGGRYVIIGQGEAGAESFSSLDGRTWERGDTLAGEAYVRSITETDEGLAAGGSIHVGDDRFLPAVWHSPDGLRWGMPEELPVEGTPQEPTVTAIIQTPSGLVGLGYAYYEKPVAQGWIRSAR
jgi:hypothetical protein